MEISEAFETGSGRERGEKVKAGENGRLELDGIIIIKLYNELIIKLIYAVR